jgi:L-cysteine S-thiosulfotransferase
MYRPFPIVICLTSSLFWGATAYTLAADKTHPGGRLARDVNKGNCLACHQIPQDSQAVTSANIGPPLLALRGRFPDRAALRAQVWDAAKANPDTIMPPYGRNNILTTSEIEQIVEYLYALDESAPP